MRPIRFGLAVLAAALAVGLAGHTRADDEPEIAVQVEPSEIYIGESAITSWKFAT